MKRLKIEDSGHCAPHIEMRGKIGSMWPSKIRKNLLKNNPKIQTEISNKKVHTCGPGDNIADEPSR